MQRRTWPFALVGAMMLVSACGGGNATDNRSIQATGTAQAVQVAGLQATVNALAAPKPTDMPTPVATALSLPTASPSTGGATVTQARVATNTPAATTSAPTALATTVPTPTLAPTASAQQLNQPMTIQSAGSDASPLRAYLANVDFTVVSVERMGTTSVIWTFTIQNRNPSDYIALGYSNKSYMVSSSGTKLDPLSWERVQVTAGERKTFTAGFKGEGKVGETDKLLMTTYADTGSAFSSTDVTWLPLDVMLSGQPTVAPTVAPIPQPLSLNQRLTIQSAGSDESRLRAYFTNVEFSLVSVTRASGSSILCTFSLWNRNATDYIALSYSNKAYMISSAGTKHDALGWERVQAVAGERKTFTVAFSIPAPGESEKLLLITYADTGSAFSSTNIAWQPLMITLP